MSVFNFLKLRYKRFFDKRRVDDGHMQFSEQKFIENSNFSPAFNQVAAAELSRLVKSYDSGACNCDFVCRFKSKCQLLSEFAMDDIIWLGLKRQIRLASKCEIDGYFSCQNLSDIGDTYYINDALAPEHDFDIIQRLNQSRATMKVLPADINLHFVEPTLAFKHQIGTEQVKTTPVKISLSKITAEPQSILKLSNLECCSLFWIKKENNLARFSLFAVDGVVPVIIDVDLPSTSELSKQEQQPVWFDIFVSKQSSRLVFQVKYQLVLKTGKRESITIE